MSERILVNPCTVCGYYDARKQRMLECLISIYKSHSSTLKVSIQDVEKIIEESTGLNIDEAIT